MVGLAEALIVTVTIAIAIVLASNGVRQRRGAQFAGGPRRFYPASTAMLGAAIAGGCPGPRWLLLLLSSALTLLATWYARPRPSPDVPPRMVPRSLYEIFHSIPDSWHRVRRWKLEPADHAAPHPLVVLGLTLLLAFNATAAVASTDPVTKIAAHRHQDAVKADPDPTLPPTPPSGVISDAPQPPPDEALTTDAPTPSRPLCATNKAVLHDLGAGGAPAHVVDVLYRAWAQWNWPALGCVTAPTLTAGHWLAVVGESLLVANKDATQAAAVFPEEAPLFQARLGLYERINQRLPFGRGALQLARLTDGSCELAGHHRDGKPFRLNSDITALVLDEARFLGAVPFAEGPTPATGAFGVRVRFLLRTGADATLRLAEAPARTVTWEPATRTASLGIRRARHAPCPATAETLESTVSAVKAAAQ